MTDTGTTGGSPEGGLLAGREREASRDRPADPEGRDARLGAGRSGVESTRLKEAPHVADTSRIP